jgi:hypothetical protein
MKIVLWGWNFLQDLFRSDTPEVPVNNHFARSEDKNKTPVLQEIFQLFSVSIFKHHCQPECPFSD